MNRKNIVAYPLMVAVLTCVQAAILFSQERNLFEEMLRDSLFEKGRVSPEPEEPKEGEKEVTLKDGKVLLNFEDVDITTVLSTISDLTGLNFIMGSDIRGTVTIKTAKEIREEDVLDFLEIILATYNFTMVRRGDAVRVLPLAEASREGLITSTGTEIGEDLRKGEKVVTHIIPLTYASSKELSSQFRNIISQGGSIIDFEKSNTLVITDYTSNVERILKIIKEVDRRPVAGSTMQTFVHYLENAIADSLAQVLRELFQETGARSRQTPALFRRARGDTAGIRGEMIGELNIVADRATNSLVIRTTPPNYEILRETIDKLDIMPKQVLIEVLIAEISLDQRTEWGLDFLFTDRDHLDQSGMTATVEGQFGLGRLDVDDTPGLRYGIMQPGRVEGTLRALASVTDMDVLSTPNVLTSDNKQARIMVGEEVPFVSSTRTLEGGVIDETVEFRDVGIELTVTPHINNERFVTLDIYQAVNNLTSTVIFDAQVITKREAETSVVVKDRETVVIGGLITEDKTVSESGIPFLKDIPLLGYLFKRHSTVNLKRELIILLTPYVIENVEESRRVTEQQKSKSKLFKESQMNRIEEAIEGGPEEIKEEVIEEGMTDEGVKKEEVKEEEKEKIRTP
ncbi:MAG: secretin N-terminal domain-containing protein [Candidatus Glassbacteria bacterium]